MKHYPKLNLDMLSSRISSSSDIQIVLEWVRVAKQHFPLSNFVFLPSHLVNKLAFPLYKRLILKWNERVFIFFFLLHCFFLQFLMRDFLPCFMLEKKNVLVKRVACGDVERRMVK